MFGIAPIEVDEELQDFGDLGMADPLLRCPWRHLYTGGLGPLPPQPVERVATRIQMRLLQESKWSGYHHRPSPS